MPRIEKRVDYRHFPDEYTQLLLKFSADGDQILEGFTRADAETARRDLYRFRGFLQSNYNQDPLAKELCDIARDITIKIESQGEEIYSLKITTNPVVMRMRT